MIKICTVYFEGLYTPDYVSKLYRSLKRNTSIPFEFICLSDNPNVEADIVLPYNKHSDIKLHWHKLKFFSSQFAYQKPGDQIIIMDIDQIITGNIDDLIGHPVSNNELVTYGVWWPALMSINGGFYKFNSGNFNYIWDDFAENPEYWQMYYFRNGEVHFKYYGEQNYVNMKLHSKNMKVTRTPEEWLCKYTDNKKEMMTLNKLYKRKFNTEYMLLDELNDMIKVVHFTGPGKTIHKYNEKFIKDNWHE
tara:strand:- start:577 stop:1320 length:744 start_codon:yes stop_codon:yes gene_type:complete